MYNNSFGPGGDPSLSHYTPSGQADKDITTTSQYDAAGNVVATTDPLGHVTLTGYDVLNRPVKTIRSASQPTYNFQADPTLSRYKPSGQPDQDYVEISAYDNLGRVTRTQDSFGTWTLIGYDGLGRVVKTVRSASQPDFNTAADAALQFYPTSDVPDQDIVTETAYDSLGRVMSTTDPLGRRTWTAYDGLGRVIKTIANAVGTATDGSGQDPRSDNYLLSSDADKDIVSWTAYDDNGRVLSTQDALKRQTWFAYDSRGRQVKTVQNPVGQAQDGGPNDPRSDSYVPSPDPDKDIITTTTYDPQSRVQYTTDALGRRTWFAYDSLGRTVKTIVNAVGTATGGGPNDPRSDSYVPSTAADKDIISATTYDTAGRVMYTTDPLGRRTWFGYDSLGRTVKTIANAVGTATDGSGQDPRSDSYIASIDADKDLISLTTYDVQSRVTWTQDPLGRRTWLAYDALGRAVRTITNATGSATDGSAHDPRATRYAAQTDADLDLISATTFDTQGRVTWTQDVIGRKSWMAYDGLGRPRKTISNAVGTATNGGPKDPRSDVYLVSSDADMDLVSQTVYDKAGQVLVSIDPVGNETHYTYDGLGHRIQTIANFVTGTFNPNFPDQDLTTTTTYNRGGQVVMTQDVRGTQTTYTYDGLGWRLTVTQAANSALAVTSYTCYDKAGQVLRTIQAWMPAPGQPLPDARDTHGGWLFNPTTHGAANDLNRITTYTLDGRGRTISVTDPVGSSTATAYRKDGSVDTATDPLGVVTKYVYDLAGRRRLVVQNYVQGSFTDPASWVWAKSTGQWKDGHGTVIHTTPATDTVDTNILVLSEYDKAGRTTAMRDPRGNRTTYTNDALNRRTKLTDPLSHTWATRYVNANRVLQTTLTDPNGFDTQQTADQVGRLKTLRYLKETPKNTPDITLSYDKLGNQLRMREMTSTTTTVHDSRFRYDRARRLAQADYDTDGNGTIEQTVKYTYDAGGLRTSLSYPGLALPVTYHYDARGHLSNLSDWTGQQTTFSYDIAGRMSSLSRSTGLVSQYQYDPASRLQTLQHSQAGQTLGTFAYTVDARSNRTQAYEGLFQGAPLPYNDPTIAYYEGHWTADVPNSMMVTIDASAALRVPFSGTQVIVLLGTGPDHGLCDLYVDGDLWNTIDGYAAAPGSRSIPLSVVGHGSHVLEVRNRPERNLQNTTQPPVYKLRFQGLTLWSEQTIRYTYDGLARLTAADTYAGTDLTAPSIRHDGYTYDMAGNRRVKTDPNGTVNYSYDNANHLTSDSTYTYNYDNNGNLLTKQQGIVIAASYSWDHANRLLNNNGVTQTYDGQARRVTSVASGVTTQSVLDTQPTLWQKLADTTSPGNATTRYVYGPLGILAQQNSDGSWRWPIADGLGSVRSVISSAGTASETDFYSPYGEVISSTGSSVMAFGYTGEPKDGYLRARWYSPAQGQFLSLDPLEGGAGQPLGLNRYMYVQGNVVNAIDPSGLLFWSYPSSPRYALYDPLWYATAVNAHAWIERWLEDANGVYRTHLEYPGIATLDKIDAFVFRPMYGIYMDAPAVAINGDDTADVYEIEPDSPRTVLSGIKQILDYVPRISAGSAPFTHNGILPTMDKWQPNRPTGFASGTQYNWSQVRVWKAGEALSLFVGRGPVLVNPNALGATGIPDSYWIYLVVDGLILYETSRRLAKALTIAVAAITAKKALDYFLRDFPKPNPGGLKPAPGYTITPSTLVPKPKFATIVPKGFPAPEEFVRTLPLNTYVQLTAGWYIYKDALGQVFYTDDKSVIIDMEFESGAIYSDVNVDVGSDLDPLIDPLVPVWGF